MVLRGLIFDLDGTLGETLPMCFDAYRAVLHRLTGRVYSNHEIEARFGPDEEGILRALVPDRWREALDLFQEEYAAGHGRCPEPFAGVREILDECEQRAIRLALVTGKGAWTTAYTLGRWGLSDVFDPIEVGSPEQVTKQRSLSNVVRAWSIPPNQIAYVADSPGDMEAARAVGMIPLAAAWAESIDLAALETADTAALFRSVSELPEWISRAQREG